MRVGLTCVATYTGHARIIRSYSVVFRNNMLNVYRMYIKHCLASIGLYYILDYSYDNYDGSEDVLV